MPLAVGYLNNFENFIKNAVSNTIFNNKLMVLTLFLSAKNTLLHIVACLDVHTTNKMSFCSVAWICYSKLHTHN
jgi:hypothetical protein